MINAHFWPISTTNYVFSVNNIINFLSTASSQTVTHFDIDKPLWIPLDFRISDFHFSLRVSSHFKHSHLFSFFFVLALKKIKYIFILSRLRHCKHLHGKLHIYTRLNTRILGHKSNMVCLVIWFDFIVGRVNRNLCSI